MATWVNLMDLIFPIGSFYISRQSTSPASIIGGSWTQVTNAVLRGSTSIGYTGSDTHTLTTNEIPSHNHALKSEGAYDEDSWPAGLYWSNTSAGGQWRVWTTEGLGAGSEGRLYIDYQGGGQAHSIVQRSYNCFIWYRTA